MDITKLKRNKKIASKLLNVKDDKVTANEECQVMFPTRFVNVGVCSIENFTQVITCFAVIVKDQYFILNAPTLITMEPTDIETVTVNGDDYYLCTFEKDSLFMTKRDIAITDAFIFDLYIEIVEKGKVPWYLDYSDGTTLFANAGIYAGSNFSTNITIISLLWSLNAKDPDNPDKYYREGKMDKRPIFTGISNNLTYNTTYQKITGAYFKRGVNDAVLKDSKKGTSMDKYFNR